MSSTNLGWSSVSALQLLATSNETKSCRSQSLSIRDVTFSSVPSSEVFSLPTTRRLLGRKLPSALKTWTRLKFLSSRLLKRSKNPWRHGRGLTNSTNCHKLVRNQSPNQSAAKLDPISSLVPRISKLQASCAPHKRCKTRLAPSNIATTSISWPKMTNSRKSVSELLNCRPRSWAMRLLLDRSQIKSSTKTQCNWTQWWWAMLCKDQICRLKLYLKGPTANCDSTIQAMKPQGSAPARPMAWVLLQPLWLLLRSRASCKSTLEISRIARDKHICSLVSTHDQTWSEF